MRIATFNLWHGLSPSNVLAFQALEPAGRRELREKLQLDVMQRLNADIYCLQEVNPIVQRAPHLAKALGFDFKFQPDLTGIKIFGFGPPFNLASGLAVLCPQNLRFVRALQLSGPRAGFATRWLSWQVKESRYALFSEVTLQSFGRTLIVDLHLHHGLDATHTLLDEMTKLCDELDLSEAARSDLFDRLHAGNLRREQEITLLLETIARLENRYETVVVCGDFNCTNGSGVYQKMTQSGFRDCWMEAHPNQTGFTFDPLANPANHMLQANFPLSVTLEDLTFSAKAKEGLMSLAKLHESRPRRIDYVWLKSMSSKLAVSRAELFGLPDADGFAPSDHFGVVVDVN